MATEASVATDLGALLRESIDSGLSQSARSSGQMPVQIAPLPASGVVATRIPTPGEFSVVPNPPASTARPVTMDAAVEAAMPVHTAAPAKKTGGVLGIVLGAVVLASAMGGGAAWYVHHQQAKMAAAMAAQPAADVAPPTAKDAPPPAEARVEMPVLVTPPAEPKAEAKTEAKTEEAPAAADATKTDATKTDATKAEAKPAKRPHRTTKTADATPKAEAPKPVAKAEKPVVEKAEPPKPAPAAPKPAAGGAVDAVLQQQLSGAL